MIRSSQNRPHVRRALSLAGAALVGVTVLVGAPQAATAAPAVPAAAPVPASVPAASSGDPTVTRAARTSRSSRGKVSVRAWANSPTAKRIVRRESRGNCRAVSSGGTYRGKWQMSPTFWRHYGGRKYAATPDRASCAQQDIVAHRGWVASWWRPWSTY